MKKVGSKEMAGLVGLCVGVVLAAGCKTRYSNCGFDRGETVVDNGTEIQIETVKVDRKAAARNSNEYPMPGFMAPAERGDVVYPDAKPEKQPEYWQQHSDPYAGMVSQTPKTGSTVKPVVSGYTTYKVKSGDSLGMIAKKHGVSLRDLKSVNAGINYDKLLVGQTIYIPTQKNGGATSASSAKSASVASGNGGQTGVHVVKSGDILGRIARQYGVSVKDLKAANGLTSDQIKVGQKLTIPGKTASSVVKTQATEKSATSKSAKVDKAKSEVKPAVTPNVPQPVAPVVAPIVAPPAVVEEPIIETPVICAPVVATPVVSAPEMPDFGEPVPQTPVIEAPVVAPKQEFRSYTVKEGDDLFTIAIQHNVGVKIVEELNPGLKKPLVPGTVIRIPAPTK